MTGEAVPTPAEYLVALTAATRCGRPTPYVDRLLDGLQLALIVHGPTVLTLPRETQRLMTVVSEGSGTL